MRNLVFLTAFTAIALSAAPASATEFTGPRAELRGGWDRLSMDIKDEEDPDAIYSTSGHDSGFGGGAEVGYDIPIGDGLIAGAYAGVDFGGTKASASDLYGTDMATAKLGRNFTLGARIGGQVTPAVMLYAKTGYSNGKFNLRYENTSDPESNYSERLSREGIHFGLGGEMAVTAQAYVRAEYVRTMYDAYYYLGVDENAKVNLDRDQVLMGVGMRF